jgi:hypothetical protein
MTNAELTKKAREMVKANGGAITLKQAKATLVAQTTPPTSDRCRHGMKASWCRSCK